MTIPSSKSNRSLVCASSDELPLVTVVIPAYNREAYIGEAIDSALHQVTEFPFEVIVSDDCSSDGTVDVVRSYGEQVRVIVSKSNDGPSANRNRAIQAARGEYIVMLDDDDRMLAGRIQNQVGFLVAHPNIDLAVGLLEKDDSDVPMERYFRSKGIEVDWGEWTIIDDWRTILLTRFIGTPSASVYRTSLFDRAGYFDPTIWVGDDVEFLTRASRVTPLACFNWPVSWQRTGHAIRLTTSMRWSIQSVDLLSHLLHTVPDLSDREKHVLEGNRRTAVRTALGASVHGTTRSDLKRVIKKYAGILPMRTRMKWLVISFLPWFVVRRLALLRQSRRGIVI